MTEDLRNRVEAILNSALEEIDISDIMSSDSRTELIVDALEEKIKVISEEALEHADACVDAIFNGIEYVDWIYSTPTGVATDFSRSYIDKEGNKISSDSYLTSPLITSTVTDGYSIIMLTPPRGKGAWITVYDNDAISSANFVAQYGDYENRRTDTIICEIKPNQSFVVSLGVFSNPSGLASYSDNEILEVVRQISCKLLSPASDGYTEEIGDYSGFTSTISGTYVQLNYSYDDQSDTLKLYGTAPNDVYILCLNGQNSRVSTGTAFNKTFDAGTYTFEVNASGYSGTRPIRWAYTYGTFSSGVTMLEGNEGKVTVTFDRDAMVGLSLAKYSNFGTESEPTSISISISKITAVDSVARVYVEESRDICAEYAEDAADSAATAQAVLDRIPADYTALSNDVDALKATINDVDSILSDGSALLSGSLVDKSATSSSVSYALSGNTITVSGTASGTSSFTLLGSTSSAPPEWMRGGGKYIFNLVNNTPAEVRFQAKTATQTSMLSFAVFERSGVYIVTIPDGITVFRLILVMNENETADGTITLEISNAVDLEGLTDDMDDIKSDRLNLATDTCPVIPDNTDFNTYTMPGTYKVTNNTHAGTMLNIPLKMAGKLLVMALSQTARAYQIYASSTSDCATYVRYYNGSAWSDWQALSYKTYGYAKHTSGSFDSGKATEELDVYMPATVGYIKYVLYHYVNSAIGQNYDVWRIYHAYHVSNLSDDNLVDLTVSGEWECAVHLDGRDDFSGGSTHGDEIMTDDVVVLKNGKPISLSTLSSLTPFYTLTLVRTSKLYDPSDHTTVIADHGVQYDFDVSAGLTINQSVIWRVVETLTNCYLCMFLPSKDVLDRAVANSDFKTIVLPSSTAESLVTVTKSKATAVDMWDTSTGASAAISIPAYPTGLTGGDRISISDNSGNDYNKLYFKVCGGGTSANGEMWKSTSVYKLDYYN